MTGGKDPEKKMENDRELAELRRRINAINDEILELFIRRMKVSDSIALFKKESGIAILDANREREIMEDMRHRAGEYGPYAEKLFRYLLELSRERQREIIAGETDERES